MLIVITDQKAKDCGQCPLKPSLTRDCGKVISRKIDHAQQYCKIPDKKCRVKKIISNKT